MTFKMPKSVQEQFTNILLFLVAAFGGVLGTTILTNQKEMQKDITEIKISIGIGNQKNIDQDDDIKRLKDVKGVVKLFKHEPIFSLENK
jgi:hypothetical protein